MDETSHDHFINHGIPAIAGELQLRIQNGLPIETEEGLNLAGRKAIYDILDDILAILFPGAYSRQKVPAGELNFYLCDLLRHVGMQLCRQIREALEYYCIKEHCETCTCRERSESATRKLIEGLPQLRQILMSDIHAGLEGDPAAVSADEIVLSYPFVEAVATYRIAHLLYEQKVPLLPRIMSERAHSNTGIDIHPGATIGEGFFIDHGTGVVIGETATIGRNVKMYQGVTIGALSPFDEQGNRRKGQKRHPDIEDDVIIYANAAILGGRTVVGKGAVIGGNTWITRSVPAGAVVVNTTRNETRGTEGGAK
jgi:serine O-acetyltransferase